MEQIVFSWKVKECKGKKQKNAIMKAMMEQTGLASKEKTIIFSLPVTSTVGLRMYIDEMDMDEEEKDR